MEITPTKIPEVILIKPQVHGDERGFFMETYQIKRFAAAGIPHIFLQDNHSGSQQGTLRGLHYQIRQPQGKLIRVIAGEIYDVAVDIRQASPTFGQWVGATISAASKEQIWVPAGFAHGFYVISEWAELVYKATDLYNPAWERTLLWNDPEVGIDWPLLEGQAPLISPKDRQGTPLAQADLFT